MRPRLFQRAFIAHYFRLHIIHLPELIYRERRVFEEKLSRRDDIDVIIAMLFCCDRPSRTIMKHFMAASGRGVGAEVSPPRAKNPSDMRQDRPRCGADKRRRYYGDDLR